MATILYIEDDASHIEIVRRIVAKDGHVLLAAQNGVDGLAIAEREAPDVILLDINLPVMNGVQVAQKLRSEPKIATIPRVAVTTNTMHGDRDYYLRNGFDAYVPKPIMRNELLMTIRSVLS